MASVGCHIPIHCKTTGSTGCLRALKCVSGTAFLACGAAFEGLEFLSHFSSFGKWRLSVVGVAGTLPRRVADAPYARAHRWQTSLRWHVDGFPRHRIRWRRTSTHKRSGRCLHAHDARMPHQGLVHRRCFTLGAIGYIRILSVFAQSMGNRLVKMLTTACLSISKLQQLV